MKGNGVSKTARASMQASTAGPKGKRPVRVISYETGRKREWTEWREPEA
jgi:hypothetical protein